MKAACRFLFLTLLSPAWVAGSTVSEALNNVEAAIGLLLEEDERLGVSLSGVSSWGTYSVFGTTKLTIEGETIEVDLGTESDPGLQVSTQWFTAPKLNKLNLTIKERITLAGLGIDTGDDGVSVDYDAESGNLQVSGEVDVSFDGESIGAELGSADEPGVALKINEDGSVELESADIDLNSSFTLFGLEVATDPTSGLDFQYSADEDRYEVYGGLELMIEGEKVGAVMGNADAPGLLIKDGAVDELAIGISADLEVGGFKFAVKETNPLDVRYTRDPDGDHYLVSGDVVLEDLWKVELVLGSEAHPGLKIVDGVWDLESLTIDVEKINLGFVTLKQVKVVYGRETNGSLDLGVDLKVSIPEIGELDADVKIVAGKLDEIGLEYQATGSSEGLEIAETGVSIAEIGAKVTNIDQPVDLGVDGTVGIEFGGQLDIMGTTVTLIRVNGAVSVDKNHFYMKDDFFLGAYRESAPHSPWKGILFDGEIVVDLNWVEDRYFFEGEVKVPLDYGLFFDAKLLIDSRVVDALITSEVRIPMSIPLIGGIDLSSVSAAVHLDNIDKTKDYAAAWTTFIAWTVGVEYLWNTGDFSMLDGSKVTQIENQINSDIENLTVVKEFVPPTGATGVSIELGWGKEIDQEIDLVIMGPVNTPRIQGFDFFKIQPMKIDDTGVSLEETVVEKISTGSTLTVFVSETESTGDPFETNFPAGTADALKRFQVTMGIPRSLGIDPSDVTMSVTGHYPNSSVGSPVVGGQGSPSDDSGTDYRQLSSGRALSVRSGTQTPIQLGYWMVEKHTPDATVSLYLDDNDSGYDGRLIVRDLPYGEHDEVMGGALTHNWAIEGFVPRDHDQYYVYARLNHDDRSPVYSPYSGPIQITPALRGRVFDSSEGGRALSGMRMYLDVDGNGSYDPGSDPTDLTNSHGEYAFHVLPSGQHRVGLVVPNGHQLNGVGSGARADLVAVTIEEEVGAVQDFDIHRRKTISGVIFHDLDDDGVRGSSESGIKGVRLYLDFNDNARRDPGETRSITNSSGEYRFHDIEPEALHRVRVDIHSSLFNILPIKSHIVLADDDPLSDHEAFDFPVTLEALSDVVDPDYATWANEQFQGPVDEDSLKASDPDADGVSNWIEFLIGTDPLDPASTMLPMSAWINSGTIDIAIPAMPGARYVLEQTIDFENWSVLRAIKVDTPETIQVSVDVVEDARPLFFRLRLEAL